MWDPIYRALDTEYHALRRGAVNGINFSLLRFSVMHGNGNIIVVVDETLSGLTSEQVNSALARETCQAFRTLRIDGVSFLRRSGDRVKMTYFERDGTHSKMCGNALRCSALYCHEQDFLSSEGFIETDDGEKWVSATRGWVRAALGEVRDFRELEGDRYFAFSGLPHVVVLVSDLEAIDVKATGSALRYDLDLCDRLGHPDGVHVDFMQRNPKGISVRTYEVGVEDETLSCGTGVGASAHVASRAWRVPFPIYAKTRGGSMMVENGKHGLVISGTVEYLFSNILTRARAWT